MNRRETSRTPVEGGPGRHGAGSGERTDVRGARVPAPRGGAGCARACGGWAPGGSGPLCWAAQGRIMAAPRGSVRAPEWLLNVADVATRAEVPPRGPNKRRTTAPRFVAAVVAGRVGTASSPGRVSQWRPRPMEERVEVVSAGIGSQPRHHGLLGFLHGLARSPVRVSAPGAGHPARFDGRPVSASGRHDAQPEDVARRPGAVSKLGIRHRRVEHLDGGPASPRPTRLSPSARRRTTLAHGSPSAVARPHTPVSPRAAADHGPDRFVGDPELFGRQSVVRSCRPSRGRTRYRVQGDAGQPRASAGTTAGGCRSLHGGATGDPRLDRGRAGGGVDRDRGRGTRWSRAPRSWRWR